MVCVVQMCVLIAIDPPPVSLLMHWNGSCPAPSIAYDATTAKARPTDTLK